MKKLIILIILVCVASIQAQDLETVESWDLDSVRQDKESLWAEKPKWPWSGEKEEEINQNKFIIPNILELEVNLAKKIFGQFQAIQATVNSLFCYQVGLNDPYRPIGTLLYIGPTGVGKTELAKELARQIFKDEKKLIRLDMSEYTEEGGIFRLIGPPLGYIDSESGGTLSNAILAHPNSIVLLDEIEKAHPKIRELFLHIFDEGYFTSGRGVGVNCRNCLFIVTTNIGAQHILKLQQLDEPFEAILEEIEPQLIKILSPELYNRVEPVIFTGLTPDMLSQIVDKQLKALALSLNQQKRIQVVFDESLKTYLTEKGYHPQLGARPLERLIKNEVKSLIAKTLIRDGYTAGDHMHISYSNSQIILTKLD